MIKVLFFDFDGTIADAKEIAFKTMLETFEKYNYNVGLIKKLLGMKIPKILEQISVRKEQRDKIKKYFYDSLIKKVYKLKLCVSVKPLWELRKEYKMIVISNSESSFVRASAKKLRVDKLFNSFYGAESFSSKDKILKKLFKKFKIKPREAVYIGDRFSDIEYARKAGCYSIAIYNKCSWSSLKEIKAEKPDFIVKDFCGLENVLKNLKGGLYERRNK